MEREVKIPKMSCEYCADTVEQALKNLFSVQKVSVDVPTRMVRVAYRSPEDWVNVIRTLEKVGFPPET